MSVGGILGESWGLYTKFFKRFFLIALIVYLIVDLLNALVATLFGHSVGIALLLALVTMVVSLVGTFWLQGALVFRWTTCGAAGSTAPSNSCSSGLVRTSGR